MVGPSRPFGGPASASRLAEREFFVDNLLVRIHIIIEMIWWTGLAPWETPGTSLGPALPPRPWRQPKGKS